MSNKITPLAAKQGTLHFCPIYGTDVSKEQCQQQSVIVQKNMEVCCAKSCYSPWRFCVACLRQGYRGSDRISVNPEKGMCQFHLVYGPNANRSGIQISKDGQRVPPKDESRQAFKVTGEVIKVNTSRVRPFASQPRAYFDPIELEFLKQSIKKRGQIVPAILKVIKGNPHYDFELIDGQRRWIVCSEIGIPLKAIVETVVDIEDQFEVSIVANFQRPGHTPLEIAKAVHRLVELRSRTIAEIAELFGKSVSWIMNHRKLLRLHPQIQAQLEPTVPEEQRLTVTLAFQLADLPHDLQFDALKKIQEAGLNVNQARHLIRQQGQLAGIRVGGIRTPRKDFQILKSYLRKVHGDAQLFIGMSEEQRNAMFKSRAQQDLAVVIGQIEQAVKDLTVLRTALEKAKN